MLRIRCLQTSSASSLKKRLADLIPVRQQEVTEFRKKHGGTQLGTVTVDMLYGGMRGIKGLLWEGSVLDAEEGIRFRGHSLPDCVARLPRVEGKEPVPEGILYLLLTGTMPSSNDVASVSEDLRRRAEKGLPDYVVRALNALPKDTHPMTQLSIGVLALQRDSAFARAYREGKPKSTLWEPAYEDSLNLLARLPLVAAHIFHSCYTSSSPPSNNDAAAAAAAGTTGKWDWAGDFASRLGVSKDPAFKDLMRLYLTIHADHEGGNVSAHTSHLVGSALADPYLSFSAALNGLAGPLHGLANQEVLKWLQKLQETLRSERKTGGGGGGGDIKDQELETMLEAFVERTLKEGRVVPGYGHAVLRKTDPRYTCQREFALRNLPNDDLFRLVSALYKVVPNVLSKRAKIKNPWPNVDAHSGVLLHHYGLVQDEFYTVLFGVSRAIGCLSGYIWSRALGLPIERPKSYSTEALKREVSNPSADAE